MRSDLLTRTFRGEQHAAKKKEKIMKETRPCTMIPVVEKHAAKKKKKKKKKRELLTL
jgi:hypothetical protein